MSDAPRRSDAVLATATQRDEVAEARAGRVAAERRASRLVTELHEREVELEALHAEVEQARADKPAGDAVATDEDAQELRAQVRELSRRLRAHELEYAAARREMERLVQREAEKERRLTEALGRRDEQRAAHQAETEELRSRLAARERELKGATAASTKLAAKLTGREEELSGLREQLTALRVEHEQTEGRLADAEGSAAAAHTGEASARAATDQVTAMLRQQLDAADLRRQRLVSEYTERVRQLEQRVSVLTVALQQTRADVERALESRAWRVGHRLMRIGTRMTFRRVRTKGALNRALTRLEQLEAGSGEESDPGDPAGRHGVAPESMGAPLAAAAVPSTPPDPELEARARALLAQEIRFRLGPPPTHDSWPSVSIVVPTRDARAHLERLLAGLAAHTDYPTFELIAVVNGEDDGSRELLEAGAHGFPVTVVDGGPELSFSAANRAGTAVAGGELLLLLNDDVEPFEAGWLRELVGALIDGDAQLVGATLLHPDLGGAEDPEPRVQHRAVRFRRSRGAIAAYNDGDGVSLWEADFGTELRVPAVTAACALIRREDFAACGGLAQEYRFGDEDVDLGLRMMRSGGSVLASGRAVLIHRQSATQARQDGEIRHHNRARNRRVFAERWAPLVAREYAGSRLKGIRGFTDGAGPHAALTVTRLDPAAGWGDWYTAHDLGDALQAIGWRVSYVERLDDAWYALPEDVDYVVSLLDTFDLRRVPDGATAVVWIRNWTERWLDQPWFARADVVLASSGPTAELVRRATGREATLFPIAVNPARFSPRVALPELAADYVFTGNRWGKSRALEGALAPARGETFAVYGRGWSDTPKMGRHVVGDRRREELPDVYASAKLVLDDTQGPTLPYGAVNGRVFEALAVGTLVISDCEVGVRELFDDEFPVWSSRETLRVQLDELLGDEARRTALAARYRARVLSEHTYAQRADTLRRLLLQRAARPSVCLKVGAPNRAVAHRWGDLHFAEAMARGLSARGHATRTETLDEWESSAGLRFDVVLHLRGLSRYHVKPGQFNVLWSISHPGDLTGEECDAYDLVLVGSAAFAAELGERTATPVEVLEQATDPRVFFPDPRPEYAHDLVYVANSRNVLRPIVRDLLPTDWDLAIWGANWDGLIDTRHVVAEHIPNAELRYVYSSARIVLCDHWDDMREHGYVSNRVYDALACGAYVLCDDVPGLRERFGDAVGVYSDRADLLSQIEARLAEPPHPPGAGLPGGATFAARASRLAELLDGRLSDRTA